jgi:hypothetical protein
MRDTELLASIAREMMSSNTVDVNGKPLSISRTSKNRLRTLGFSMDGRGCQALNRTPRSRALRSTCDTSPDSGRHIHRNSTHVDIKITYAEMPSRWGQLARDGHQVVTITDSATNRFVAMSVDGEMKIYRDGHGTRRK